MISMSMRLSRSLGKSMNSSRLAAARSSENIESPASRFSRSDGRRIGSE
jgi:hypothetical protein